VIYIPVYIVYPKSIKELLTKYTAMGLDLGPLIEAFFPKKKKEKLRVKKSQERPDSRKYIKQATRTIKRAVKEPEELPTRENVPAIREFFENGIETP
jgi:hypothetical protein